MENEILTAIQEVKLLLTIILIIVAVLLLGQARTREGCAGPGCARCERVVRGVRKLTLKYPWGYRAYAKAYANGSGKSTKLAAQPESVLVKTYKAISSKF